MHARLVRHVSSSGRTRVLVTSLSEDVASVAELADLYHGRWRIEEAFKRLKHRLGLESVSGLSQHALLVDVATKVLADNLAALLNLAVPMVSGTPQAQELGVRREVNRAAAAKLFSRCIGSMLLVAGLSSVATVLLIPSRSALPADTSSELVLLSAVIITGWSPCR